MARETNVNIVGLGTQDSLGEAQEFVTEFGTNSFPMVWDPSFSSWLELGVSAQPTWILYDSQGNAVRGSGPIDEALVRSYSS